MNGKTNLYLPKEFQENSDSKEFNNNLPERKASQEKYVFPSELVFIINHAFILQLPSHQQYQELVQKEMKLLNLQGRLPLSFKKIGFLIHLNDPFYLSHLYKLLTFDILFILFTFNIPLIKIEYFDKIFEDISSHKAKQEDMPNALPIYWTENIQEVLMFLRQFNPEFLLKEPKLFHISINFLLLNLGKDSFVTNPHLKAKHLQFLSSFIPGKKKEIIPYQEFLALFNKNQFFQTRLIQNLSQYFIQVGKTLSDSSGYENYSYKHGCGVIINYLFDTVVGFEKDSFLTKSIFKYSELVSDEYLQFWKIILEDIIALITISLEKLQEIKTFQEETLTRGIWILGFDGRHEKLVKHEQNKKQTPALLSYLKTNLMMLAFISEVFPDFLSMIKLEKSWL